MKYCFLFLCFLFFSCSTEKNQLKIACASNLKQAISELSLEFEKECNCKVELITASSGQLANQILNGAPYDLFLSASLEHAGKLNEEGFTDEPTLVFADGRLILWTMKDVNLRESLLEFVQLKSFAIPNPETAPFGYVAMDYLVQNKFIDNLRPHLVFGESVSQTNIFISTGSADLGITSKSALFESGLKNKGTWIEIPSYKHQSLPQSCIILNTSKKKDLSLKFQDFLGSKKAKNILLNYGYDLPEPRAF